MASLFRINKPRHPQASFHVKKNDEVVVLTGTQRGKRGKVLEVLRDRHRVIVEGVNLIKKTSQKTQQQPQGGILEREGPLHISKVMLASEYDGRKTKTKAKPAAQPAAKASAQEKPVAQGKK